MGWQKHEAESAGQRAENCVTERRQQRIRRFPERFGERVKTQFQQSLADCLEDKLAKDLDQEFKHGSGFLSLGSISFLANFSG
ncbi:MAG: hypothetical protein WBK19_17030 [Azonexus sp.]